MTYLSSLGAGNPTGYQVIKVMNPYDCTDRGGVLGKSVCIEQTYTGSCIAREYECVMPLAAPSVQSGTSGPVNVSVNTQVSPQISPVFQQQYQPTNSPATAGTSQTSGGSGGSAITQADIDKAVAAANAAALAREQAMVEAIQKAGITSQSSAQLPVSAPPPATVPQVVYQPAPSYEQMPASPLPSSVPSAPATETVSEPDIVDWKIPAIIGLGLFAIFAASQKGR